MSNRFDAPPEEDRGKTATWAKMLAGLVLVFVLPLVIWFLLSLPEIRIPW
ncbi:hypothetical protein MBT84_40195 [Streptomyces sp. MBT84]|nr:MULTISPECIES: hypothetical protein [unclassified Streptomyces]MBW8705851.1 hypothetical protein [Streptomyces sp. MBT84]MDX3265174.1 hypothetical protein [Streptomyces sp. MI02-2A]REE58673.1 hypothetical protein BX257_1101 [Streptomyces sp. 3212.3]